MYAAMLAAAVYCAVPSFWSQRGCLLVVYGTLWVHVTGVV